MHQLSAVAFADWPQHRSVKVDSTVIRATHHSDKLAKLTGIVGVFTRPVLATRYRTAGQSVLGGSIGQSSGQ